MVDTAKKRERRANGLCTDCGAKVFRGKSLCYKHWISNLNSVRLYREKNREAQREKSRATTLARIANNQCTRCGKPLDEYDCNRHCIVCCSHKNRISFSRPIEGGIIESYHAKVT